MKKIKLSHGEIVLVDNDDFSWISEWTWRLSSVGYAYRNGHYYDEKGKWKTYHISLHREIVDARKGQVVDHINRKKLDNRKKNLRFCTTAENVFNSKVRKDNSSGTTGVRWRPYHEKWQAEIGWKGKTKYIGMFKRKKDAIEARFKMEKKLYPNLCA